MGDVRAVLTIAFAVGLLAVGAVLADGATGAAGEGAEACPVPAEAAAATEAAGEVRPRLEDLPAEVQLVLRKLDEASAGLEDVTARLTYERVIPLLEETQRARGSLIFKKPDRIALKLGKPRNEEVYCNGQNWWVVSHDEKQVEVYQAAERGEDGSQETAFLEFGYGSSAESILEEYDAELVSKSEPEGDDEPTVYRLKFTARERPDRPARYAAVEVELANDVWLPRLFVLHESGGEIIHTYRLSRIRTNTEVADDAFECEPPRGYNVVRL